MKKITIKNKEEITLDDTHFYAAKNGEKATQNTTVAIKYLNKYLTVSFKCEQNPFVNENTYFQDNTEMWNQEVFELFIGAGSGTLTKYLEIEINPNNAIFVAKINNPTAIKGEIDSFISPAEAGITHGVQKGEDSWQGFFSIPLQLLGTESNNFRINFYRIISRISHKKADWQCSDADCDFICWSPTMSGEVSSFHRPAMFGLLTLQD
jgi:hypothetical protein